MINFLNKKPVAKMEEEQITTNSTLPWVEKQYHIFNKIKNSNINNSRPNKIEDISY